MGNLVVALVVMLGRCPVSLCGMLVVLSGLGVGLFRHLDSSVSPAGRGQTVNMPDVALVAAPTASFGRISEAPQVMTRRRDDTRSAPTISSRFRQLFEQRGAATRRKGP